MSIRVVFIQNIWREYFGVMSLSAVLKQAGHEVFVVIDSLPERAVRRALSLGPDLAGFSITNCEQSFACKTSERLKRIAPNIVTAVGGPHPTLFPDLINVGGFDFLCRGEGETAIVQLAEAIDTGQIDVAIPGLVGKSDAPNEVKPGALIRDLDSLPRPDRSAYYRHKFLRKNPVRFFMTGRGCPYKCTFCFNSTFASLYDEPAGYVRRRSPESVIEEIASVVADFPTRTVRFEDDVFTLSRKWLSDFLERYRQRVGLPFFCYIRAGTPWEVIRELADSGCKTALFGIETGDEATRNELLQKKVTNEQILETAANLKRAGIHFFTTNMLGLPGEDWSKALKTLRLNQRLKALDTWASVFQPYSGLPLTNSAVEKGWLAQVNVGAVGSNTFSDNPLDLPDASRIFNLHKLFFPLVRWPWLEPLLLPLTKLPENRLFHYLFVLFYVVGYRKRTGVGLTRLIVEGAHWFRVFLFESKTKPNDCSPSETEPLDTPVHAATIRKTGGIQ
jgi:radical SAM superfamily enzyme YgiQ (UPF0313 family)